MGMTLRAGEGKPRGSRCVRQGVPPPRLRAEPQRALVGTPTRYPAARSRDASPAVTAVTLERASNQRGEIKTRSPERASIRSGRCPRKLAQRHRQCLATGGSPRADTARRWPAASHGVAPTCRHLDLGRPASRRRRLLCRPPGLHLRSCSTSRLHEGPGHVDSDTRHPPPHGAASETSPRPKPASCTTNRWGRPTSPWSSLSWVQSSAKRRRRPARDSGGPGRSPHTA